MEQRLVFFLRSPEVIENAIRRTLTEAIALRRMHAGTIDARSFANRALELLMHGIEAGTALEAIERHELAAETVAAAGRFFTSKIGRRLLTIEPRRLEDAPHDADAAVRDRAGRIHVVRLETAGDDAARVDLGRGLRDRASTLRGLHAPVVHLFSLRDGRLRSFTFAEPMKSKKASTAA